MSAVLPTAATLVSANAKESVVRLEVASDAAIGDHFAVHTGSERNGITSGVLVDAHHVRVDTFLGGVGKRCWVRRITKG